MSKDGGGYGPEVEYRDRNPHFNKLDPAQAERLALLLEECGETIRAVGKILRHGYDSHHPDNPDIKNPELLEKEIGDILAAVDLMREAGDVSRISIQAYKLQKLNIVKKWLHHQPKWLLRQMEAIS